MKSRQPAARPGSFRPAAAVARDLLKLAASKNRKARPVREAVRHVRPLVVDDEPETAESPAPAKITLAPATVTGGLSDEDIGLPRDDVAQEGAERFLRAAYAFRLREAEKEAARQRLLPGPTVHVEIPDDSVALVSPTNHLSPLDVEILRELKRLARRGGDGQEDSRP